MKAFAHVDRFDVLHIGFSPFIPPSSRWDSHCLAS
jgi:hypothetical protein